MIFFRPLSGFVGPSRLCPWMVFMVSSIGGLVIPEMRVGEVAISRVWLLEVGIEGVPLLVPVLDSEVLTFVRDDKRPSPVTELVAGRACSATSG